MTLYDMKLLTPSDGMLSLIRTGLFITAEEVGTIRAIVAELQKNPELADYDMETIEISVKKKITPQLKQALA